ncbi:MAG: 3-oxoacyl-[acyl-carrier protein] reductase [Actinomycetota bacterium]|jgi:3-oxoacyl-[acyl-carrier protein] reductase|nr:3-oxoacyl-[acyl-carrier protein] reductase [Actinomycetota bacterium]
MDLGLRGRTALVTASSKGLGKGSALAFAEEGANVVICARGVEALRDAEREIAALGVDVLAIEADVTEPSAPRSLVDRTLEAFGGIDIVVANAGGPPPGGSFDPADEDFESAFNANFLTSVRLVKEAVPHMRAKGWGRCCLITSTSVKEPIPGLALSNVSRTGLWAWAKLASKELFDDGITLNLACPGLHATERSRALGIVDGGEPVGDPADFGRVVAFLCSEPARFVSGVALQVDGGRIKGLL